MIASGWFVLGPEVEAFEAEFAAASGVPHAVGVGTGTDAITLILRALDIGPGDEVITPPLSAAYSALAVMMAGARPVFADIDPERLTLDPRAVEAAITPRTRALLPVHLYGQAADMRPLEAIAAKHHLALVEDAAQAHLATADGRPVGTIGVAAATSFYPTKNLGALGDGGAVLTRDAQLAARVKRLAQRRTDLALSARRIRREHAASTKCRRRSSARACITCRGGPRSVATIAARYRAALGGSARARAARVRRRARLSPVSRCSPTRRDRVPGAHARPRHRDADSLPGADSAAAGAASTSPAMCAVADRVCAQVVSLPMYPALSDAAVSRRG